MPNSIQLFPFQGIYQQQPKPLSLFLKMRSMKNTKPESAQATKPPFVQAIEKILGKALYPGPSRGIDPVANAIRARLDPDQENDWLAQYSLSADGQQLRALNLMHCGLDDAQWQRISSFLDGALLEGLNLRGNHLRSSPLSEGMTQLRYLDLCDNDLQEFQLPPGSRIPEFIFLAGNKNLATPPPELVQQGRFAIADYYRDLLTQGVEKLYEAKLVLVGDGRAGKTTLRDKLKDPAAPLPPEDASTKGVDIDIDKYEFIGASGQPFRVNIWDFAGQDKYQPIHQFFYTHRALYVLVENAREQKTDFDQWLQMLQICSDNSTVLLVHNEFGDQSWPNFPFVELQRKYPFLKEEFRVNFATGRGLSELKQAIEYHIQRLPHVGEALPKKWAQIRTGLRSVAAQEPFLTWPEYLRFCAKHELPEPDAERLSAYLHILGAMLHYADNELLKQYVILQNEWATDAVYRILEDDRIVFDTRGRFNDDDLERIWTRPDWKHMRPQLLELMKKFRLCYEVRQTKRYIAPQLLSSAPPAEYRWQPSADLQLEIRYPIMPRGLLTRFTVTRHTDIAEGQNLVWSEGVVLDWQNTRAEVTEHFNDKKIKIRVQGKDRKGLLSIIDKTFDDLHSDFEGLKSVPPEKWIPCNCTQCRNAEKPFFFQYETLLNYKDKNISDIRCDRSLDLVQVLQLIENVFDTETRAGLKMEPPTDQKAWAGVPRVFFSYSKHDMDALQELKEHLNPLVITGKLTHWDDTKIPPGEEWDSAIQRALGSAEIILFLVSSKLLSTKYVLETELREALARKEKGEAIVIPIQLRPCMWQNTELGRFQALPRKDLIINTAPDRDTAWVEVVQELLRLIEARKR